MNLKSFSCVKNQPVDPLQWEMDTIGFPVLCSRIGQTFSVQGACAAAGTAGKGFSVMGGQVKCYLAFHGAVRIPGQLFPNDTLLPVIPLCKIRKGKIVGEGISAVDLTHLKVHVSSVTAWVRGLYSIWIRLLHLDYLLIGI